MTHSPEWEADCLRWRGKVLTGEHGHWCPDYDGLPIDETSLEWPCPCRVGDAGRNKAAGPPTSSREGEA